MTKLNKLLTTTALAGLLALSATQSAKASAFGLQEGDTDWMANAYAGEVAKAYDASTAESNPAGMALLTHNEVDGSINIIAPRADFSGTNSASAGAVSPGNAAQTAPTMGLFSVWNVNPDWKLGFSVDNPYGLRVDYQPGWTGAYQSLTSAITDWAFQFSASYKIDNNWSVGGGPVINYFQANLTQAINPAAVGGLTGNNLGVTGDALGAGYDLGVMYKLDDATRFGLNYRSRIDENLSGNQTVVGPTAGFLTALNGNAKATITLPDSVRFGAYHDINDQWAVMADVAWTDWSLFQQLAVTSSSSGQPSTTITEDFKNTWFGSVGANYKLAAVPGLMLQGGLAYDESPIDNSNRTTRIPDSDRVITSLGLTYDITPMTKFHLAYAHFFMVGDNNIDNSAGLASGTIVGNYAASADTFSVGMDFQF